MAKPAKRRAKRTELVAPPAKEGRPTVFQDSYVPLALKACRLGATNAMLADFFDVSPQTISYWLANKPEFLDAVKEGRQFADANVADSLYRKATGYEHQAVKIFMVKETSFKLDDEGKEFKVVTERPELVPYMERFAPDTVACIFWLKNRRPDLWRDKIDVDGANPVLINNGTINMNQLNVMKPAEADDVYRKMLVGK